MGLFNQVDQFHQLELGCRFRRPFGEFQVPKTHPIGEFQGTKIIKILLKIFRALLHRPGNNSMPTGNLINLPKTENWPKNDQN